MEEHKGFTVVDKRGANNPVQETPKVFEPITEVVNNRIWKSTAYIIVMNQDPQKGIMILGRATGMANDGEVFVADWLFGMRYEPGFDWTVVAKQRLDTFLKCACTGAKGPCKFHRKAAVGGGWLKEDVDRIETDAQKEVPEVLLVLSRIEATRAQATRILSPRR